MVISNFEEYDDPILYDTENKGANEASFLLKYARNCGGKVLDLACGTGRVTIPLAEKGVPMIGVDVHEGMLNHAKEKSSSNGILIEWYCQDCTQLCLNEQFSFIYMVGNSFQHFLTNEEQDDLLQSISKHLEKNGVFIFNSRFPGTEELLQPTTEEYWRSYINLQGKQVDVYTIQEFDPLTQIQHYTTIRRQKEVAHIETKTHISLRYVYPKEMERLLKGHGFEIIHLYEDWNENPIHKNSYSMVYVCKKG